MKAPFITTIEQCPHCRGMCRDNRTVSGTCGMCFGIGSIKRFLPLDELVAALVHRKQEARHG